MIGKALDQIVEQDLQALVDNKVQERKTLEYKRQLPDHLDKDKREFLADVSSFANASGGDLIYGIAQDKVTGNPKPVEGLSINNVDQEVLTLENVIRDGIEPRIPSVAIRPIPLANSKVALIIRIQRSWISPHRVHFGGHDKFYSRNSTGKYQLDVSELRTAFLMSETLADRIRKFREDRISKISANETPVSFIGGAKIVLHLIPIVSFSRSHAYDLSQVASRKEMLSPIYSSGFRERYNLDGFLTYSTTLEGRSYSYVQFFRNGTLEAVDGATLQNQRIYSEFEKYLVDSMRQYLSLFRSMNIELPLVVFLTLLGVKGFTMGVSDDLWRLPTYPVDRDILLLPEAVIESYDVKAQDILKPCFDSVWNACGLPKSLNYNDKGVWTPR